MDGNLQLPLQKITGFTEDIPSFFHLLLLTLEPQMNWTAVLSCCGVHKSQIHASSFPCCFPQLSCILLVHVSLFAFPSTFLDFHHHLVNSDKIEISHCVYFNYFRGIFLNLRARSMVLIKA